MLMFQANKFDSRGFPTNRSVSEAVTAHSWNFSLQYKMWVFFGKGKGLKRYGIYIFFSSVKTM